MSNTKQRKGKMPKKTIKKTAVKKAVAKKTVAKKMTKPVAKKSAKKSVAKRVVRPVVVEAPVATQCHCGGNCCCGCGHRFIHFCIKLILLCLVFFAGALTAPYFMRGEYHAMMRHVQFDNNGCLVYDSVKCPKMLETLKEAYPDMNACITRDAFRAVIKYKHHMPKSEHMQIEGNVVEPTID